MSTQHENRRPWTMPNPAWKKIRVLLETEDPDRATGRPRADRRAVVEGIAYRFIRGCRWRHVPEAYGDDSTLHRAFHRWDRMGLFEKLWEVLAEFSPDLRDVVWKWEPPTSALRRARSG